MKKIFAPVLFIMLISLCGCTQNNGYIGPVFGSWSLVGIYEDETPLETEGETVFSFQNEVVQVVHIQSEFKKITRYGNFSISDDILALKFITELTSDGAGGSFLMPTWLYFPSDEMPLKFRIKELNGKRMILVLNDGTKELTYSFEKTW